MQPPGSRSVAPEPLLAVLIALARASGVHATSTAPGRPATACAACAAGAAAISAAPGSATAIIMLDSRIDDLMVPPEVSVASWSPAHGGPRWAPARPGRGVGSAC